MKFTLFQFIPSPSSVRPATRAGAWISKSAVSRVSKAEEFLPLVALAVAGLIFVFATPAQAQTSQFLFDHNGNLLVQTAEVSAPPQILGQPQNRIVGPDEAATFSVVAADTRAFSYQ